MSRYLTELADVIRAAGLTVIECDGWQTRARSSGGYSSGRPTHVMIHHTASGPSSDGWPDVNYMLSASNPNEPTANLYLNRSGWVWVMAAGATNTNGSGGPIDNVPADSMNTYAIGIEAGNDGVGEPWPLIQQECYAVLVAALQAAYGIPLGHCRSHREWTSRKIDPAGESRWASGSSTWNEDGFRGDLFVGWPGQLPPPEPPEPPKPIRRKRMFYYLIDEFGNQWASDMATVRWLYTDHAQQTWVSTMQTNGFDATRWQTTYDQLTGGSYGTIDPAALPEQYRPGELVAAADV